MSETEATQVSAVFEDVAKFDASALKKVDIAEKTQLPSLEGKVFCLWKNHIIVNLDLNQLFSFLKKILSQKRSI